MNTLKQSTKWAWLLLLIAAARADETPEIVCGFSPFQPTAARANIESLVQKLVLVSSPNGSRITAWDAYNVQIIFELQLPKLTYDSPQARAMRAAQPLAALRTWLESIDGRPAPAAGLRNTWAIKAPQFLQAATAQQAVGRRYIVILGSPFYLSPTEPGFQMLGGWVPTDAHLGRSMAETPFGTQERHGRLQNVTVHWAFADTTQFESEFHRYAITRFWALFVGCQGGVLSSFSTDSAQVFLAATRLNATPVGDFSIDQSDTQFAMRKVVQAGPTPLERVVQVPAAPVCAPAPPSETKPAVVMPAPLPSTLPSAPLAPPQPVSARQPAHPAPAITIEASPKPPQPTPMVRLNVIVKDQADHSVGGLVRDNFTVFENKTRQQLVLFDRTVTPVSMCVALDASGSMEPKVRDVVGTASQLICSGLPEDETAIIEFKQMVTVLQDFTTDRAAVEAALRRVSIGGGTALLDAAFTAVEHTKAKAKHSRKVVVIVTDGGERDSRRKCEEVMKALGQADVQVYVIGFVDEAARRKRQSSAPGARPLAREQTPAVALLDELARSSGAQAYYPNALTDLPAIAKSIRADLGAQYLLGYFSTQPELDGTWRSIAVKVTGGSQQGELSARTRSGYYATQEAVAALNDAPAGDTPSQSARPSGGEP